MSNIISDNISLILLLPLWIFLIIMCGRFFSVYVNKRIIYFLTLLSSLLGAGACGFALSKIKEPIEWVYPFIQINNFTINFGLQTDKLSLIIVLLLFIISFAIQLFSVSYMKNEKKNYRFFALLNLFNFSMAFMLFSPNLFQFYVFWELVGVVSYLLIGFDYKNNTKSDASKRVFLMNRFGDTALITGIIVISHYMFEYAGDKTLITLSFMDFNSISTLLMAYTSTPVFFIICFLFIIAAAVKSAQFPFYTWLQDAMEAKLPVSALLHSATMVISGIYLAIKMLPFFTLNKFLLSSLIIVGILTAIVCSILASIEVHPKKILAYSTSANLGLMFTAVGAANIKAALVFLIAHAFIKSALFILLPYEKYTSKLNLVLMCIFSLSLAGILFSGIGAKEFIFSTYYTPILSIAYLFVCFASAFYITRLFGLIYKNSEIKRNNNSSELVAQLILLFGNISLYMLIREKYHLAEPFAASIGGIGLALLVYKHNALEKYSDTPKILEKFFNKLLPYLYQKFADLCNYIDKNIFSDYKTILSVSKKAVSIVDWTEKNIMNRTVTTVSNLAKSMSKCDMQLQSGNVQTYNAYAIIITTIITAFVIIGYMLMFG